MPFSWPTFSEIAYRLWRLKRLIAVATVLPLVVLALMSVIGFGAFGFVPFAIAVFFVVAAHAGLFPNSNQETLAISLTLAILALVAPLIGGSLFGWFLFAIFAFWMIWSGQNRILGWQTSTGHHSPRIASRITTSATLEQARGWFPLRPGLVRGHFTCGDMGENGRFPVWYDAGSADWMAALGVTPLEDVVSPEDVAAVEALADEARGEPTFQAEIEVDEPEYQRTALIDDSGEVMAVVEHHFKAKRNGCIVRETENTASYPWGQTLGIWLADFATDGMVYNRDLLEERESLAIRGAHHLSLLALLSGWIFKRFLMRSAMDASKNVADQLDEKLDAEEQAVASEKLSALLQRLGPDYQSNGYTRGPMPLVTLEEFFDGNGDDASFQGAPVGVARRALQALREREDVADIRLGVTQWEGPSTWPLAEYVYFVTAAKIDDVRAWLKEANIWVSELDIENEHRRREEIAVPPGHRVVWAWID